MAYIEIHEVFKSFKGPQRTNTPVLEGISLKVERGEFVSVFGPNGCGKSTVFNLIAGLISIDSGEIHIAGKPPSESRIGYVFQDYSESLFPWLRNVDNISIALDSTIRSRKKRRKYTEDFVIDMDLGELPLDLYPYQCSAGQQQLVALMRELISRPDLLLMDEPFVSLDYDRRLSQQAHLLRTWRKTGTTIMFISHEIDEAIYLADKVVLLSKRPANLRATYNIALPRPRNTGMLTSEIFTSLKAEIIETFQEVISS